MATGVQPLRGICTETLWLSCADFAIYRYERGLIREGFDRIVRLSDGIGRISGGDFDPPDNFRFPARSSVLLEPGGVALGESFATGLFFRRLILIEFCSGKFVGKCCAGRYRFRTCSVFPVAIRIIATFYDGDRHSLDGLATYLDEIPRQTSAERLCRTNGSRQRVDRDVTHWSYVNYAVASISLASGSRNVVGPYI